jgi:dTDP-4-amino-4,6-dideoxygalactose transaminase
MKKIKFLDLKKINSRYILKYIYQLFRYLISGGYYINGSAKAKFEIELANYLDVNHILGTGNGLDALTIGFKSLIELDYLNENDEILVQNNTFIASYNAIKLAGLKPVLFDLDIDSVIPTVNQIEKVISHKTKGILLVHLYGFNAIDNKLLNYLKSKNILLIEDCAQSLGSSYNNVKCGTFGIFSAFSFYPGKNLGAIGDGGAIGSNSKEIIEMCRAIGNYGSFQKYKHDVFGVNSRLDDIQAIFLSLKLRYLDQENFLRIKQADYYTKNITNNKIKIVKGLSNSINTYHLFVIYTKEREKLSKHLDLNGIETLVHYPITISNQLFVKNKNCNLKLHESEKTSQTLLSLPIGPHLKHKHIKLITDVINDF